MSLARKTDSEVMNSEATSKQAIQSFSSEVIAAFSGTNLFYKDFSIRQSVNFKFHALNSKFNEQ